MKVNSTFKNIELSRSNLEALLAKLDGYPSNSFCTIFKEGWSVTAVEDKDHYIEQRRGVMHPDTESKMNSAG